MLPILLFELVWKTIWLIDYGLPQRMGGVNTTQFIEDFKAIALGPVILIPLIPWGYVFRQYLKKPGAPWRKAQRHRRETRIAGALYGGVPDPTIAVLVRRNRG